MVKSTTLDIGGSNNKTAIIIDSSLAVINESKKTNTVQHEKKYTYDETFGSCPLKNDGTGMCYIQCLFAVKPGYKPGDSSLNAILNSYSETQKRYYDLTTQLGFETLFNVAASVCPITGDVLDIQLKHTFPSVADAIICWKNILANGATNLRSLEASLLPQTLMPLYVLADLSTNMDPAFNMPDMSSNVPLRTDSSTRIHKPLLDANHITLHNFGPLGEAEFFETFAPLNMQYSRLLKNEEMSIFRCGYGLGDVISGTHRMNVGSARQSLARQPGPLNTRKDIPQPDSATTAKWARPFWDWKASISGILSKLGLTELASSFSKDPTVNLKLA